MKNTACALPLLAVFFLCPACRTPRPSANGSPPLVGAAPTAGSIPSKPSNSLLIPSPRRLVGRIIAVDSNRHFAIVELATSIPSLESDIELVVRADDLRETGRLRSTRQLRGRTLGTQVLSGEPALGDEVVTAGP